MTRLLYMEGFGVVECAAEITKLEEYEGKQVVLLDQTCFYPKGGGQDYDQGTITAKTGEFKVEAVFFVDGEVKHIGHYVQGIFEVGEKVQCKVQEDRRLLNTRLHSGGHILDMAVRQLNWSWVPGKGAHYPHMSFVEYSGDFDTEKKQEYIDALQARIDELISKGSHNTMEFMTPEQMAVAGAVVPDGLPKDKPSRAVLYDGFVVPCGGTHIKDIEEVGKVTVTKIKKKDGNIRVSYIVG